VGTTPKKAAGSQPAGTHTVTFKGASDGTTRVRDPRSNKTFRLDQPVSGVDAETVERLQGLKGLKFDVTPDEATTDDQES
jgi:hypothetical protein